MASGFEPGEAFAQHAKMLRTYIRRYVSDPNDAADILQEVGLVVTRLSKSPTESENFGAWCRGLARHVIRRFHRSRFRHTKLVAAFDLANSVQRTPYRSPEDWALGREQLGEILGSMSAESRELFVMRYLLGESSSEIGSKLNQTDVAVRMRLMRLRASVRPKT